MLEVRFNQQLSMDARGRVTLPARLKAALDTHRIYSLVFIAHEGRLRAYTPQDFTERVEKPLLGNDTFDPYEDEKQLLRLGSACEIDVDRQGRLVLPAELRELVNLSADITMISLLDRLELWNTADFKAAFAAARARRDTLGGAGG
jgi:MraZ protein